MLNVSERDQSEFNMAVSWLNRINYEFLMLNESKRNLNIRSWKDSLSNLFTELSTEMKANEIEDKFTELKKIWDKVDEQATLNEKRCMNNIPKELAYSMMMYEMFLRRVLKESGLQNKVKDDPRFSMK